MPIFPHESSRPAAGSICLVANDLDYLVKNGGVGTYYWLLAHLLAREGWRVHILFCGPVEDRSAVESVRRRLQEAGIALSFAKDFAVPPDFRVRTLDLPALVEASERARLALQELHRRERFDLVEFADWQAPAFRTVQAKRTDGFWDGVGLIVKLHGPSQWGREGNYQWMTGLGDLQVDHCERFAFEHADFQVGASAYILDYV